MRQRTGTQAKDTIFFPSEGLGKCTPSSIIEIRTWRALPSSRKRANIRRMVSCRRISGSSPRCLIPGFDGHPCPPNQGMRYGPGSSWERHDDRGGHRAIQHSHVWTAPADQGFVFGNGTFAGAVMSPACCCSTVTAGPDGVRWSFGLIKRTSSKLRLRCRLSGYVFVCSHHVIVTLVSEPQPQPFFPLRRRSGIACVITHEREGDAGLLAVATATSLTAWSPSGDRPSFSTHRCNVCNGRGPRERRQRASCADIGFPSWKPPQPLLAA